jgi:hypothetical protein
MMIASLVVALWLVTQAPARPADQPKITWASELGVTSLADIDSALARPFEGGWEVTTEDKAKKQIKSCREFLAVARSKFDAPNEHDWNALWSQGARCFALQALKSAKAPSHSYLGWFQLSPAAIARLPPRLAMLVSPDDLEDAAKAEQACEPWRKFDETLKVSVETAERARLRSDGWTGRLTLYARADLDGDGTEDLLLRRDGHVTGGTAADSTIFIVTQTSAKGCPKVVRAMGVPGSAADAPAP